ncbi:hypothetical protein FB567DRAFT_144278 [Paraphoma chrysanthemicola]|uniref:Zn(2)-C6 fungal-type domain-containing protein n=1 Tax=Paraphoma chrysanthemicola TaxID=798071 RepID=A0A8K0QXX2_9PLEO|nr:hypothetical protein FB567DRAFT_144278 [Paraphoma chrysanthemicola]
MVFRGKPSKACARCRERRLRCDLKLPSCSSCIRVGEACIGYRPSAAIRFSDETELVRTKAISRATLLHSRHCMVPITPRYLPHDLQAVGRDVFFAYYVSDFSRTWEFLYSYQDPSVAPEHLSLGIDAVSLAFLSHQVSSPAAKEMARKKYVAALRKINKAVQDPESSSKLSTFQGALLLDLFEKIMVPAAEAEASRHAHVEGALALVKLRGVKNFREGSELRALLGLSLNATICALSKGTAIPEAVREIRKHAAQFVDTSYPKWRLSECILEVTELPESMRSRTMTAEEKIARSATLDQKLETIALEAGHAWSYERKFVSGHDQRVLVPDGFFPLYDVYPNRMITQMWNVLRITRIQLCEDILDTCSHLNDEESKSRSQRAELVIVEMIREICASVPQMTNCEFAARHKLPDGSAPGQPHTHTMSHILDVYILIFSLYVVAWSDHCPAPARNWTMGQLEHIAEHFAIKEAAMVIEYLRKQHCKKRADPWYVYGVLGYFGLCSVAST